MGTQIHAKNERYPNMGGLGIHLHPQPTEQGSVHRTRENYQTNEIITSNKQSSDRIYMEVHKLGHKAILF
jgi:hypothetical protein